MVAALTTIFATTALYNAVLALGDRCSRQALRRWLGPRGVEGPCGPTLSHQHHSHVRTLWPPGDSTKLPMTCQSLHSRIFETCCFLQDEVVSRRRADSADLERRQSASRRVRPGS